MLSPCLTIGNELLLGHNPIVSVFTWLPYEEADNIYFKTEEMCWNNKDIFENFYHDNSELYDEITDKVLKVRKRK